MGEGEGGREVERGGGTGEEMGQERGREGLEVLVETRDLFYFGQFQSKVVCRPYFEISKNKKDLIF